ncbi:pilin [Patescibacteria group bacterium]|nr:pilin [Patescibacteria group bacterium]MCG2698781.1 pilin [Candidatus Parcubacteria bacterium]
MKLKYKILIIPLLLIMSVFLISSVLASCPDGQVCISDPLATGDVHPTIPELIGRVINGALGIVGSIALVMFIYGGFTWMTAAGNAEQITKGKNIIVWAAIGLVVIFASYSLVNFVIEDAILGTAT